MHIREAIEEYHYAILQHSEQTQVWYQSRLNAFACWCEGQQLSLEQVKPHTIGRYIDYLQHTPSARTGKLRSSYTVHGHARTIRTFLNWCCREEDFEQIVSERTPKKMVMPRLERKVIDTLAPNHIKAMFAATEKEYLPHLVIRDKAILSVLLDTGIRASELCDLTLDCVFLSPHDAFLKVHGKGNKWREVGLGSKSQAILHRYISRHRRAEKAEQHVFLTRFLKPMSINALDQMLYRLAQWAHIEYIRVSAHVWRHTYAVTYLENGGDVYKLSRLMGHTSVQITENYLKAFQSKAARKDRLSVLDNMEKKR